MIDDNGYPTDKALDKIRNWPPGDYDGLMEFVKFIWHWPDFARIGADVSTLVTGGWSGNEEILGAMTENVVWWIMHWYSSKRGGKHVFARSVRITPESED